MSICSLGSGSRGNATLLHLSDKTILIDCGFGLKETISRLNAVGCAPDDIDAILVTHEHADHIHGVESFSAKFNIPVYMTAGTKQFWRSRGRVEPKIVSAGHEFFVGAVRVFPVAVPHDAREPVQFVFCHESLKVGVLTDLGSLTPHVVEAYLDCDALLVEANHDLDMLAKGPYPNALKKRVSGAWGHLNNFQTAELIKSINSNGKLKTLVVGHISQQNNLAELAESALASVVESISTVVYASQDQPLDWVEFS